MGRPNANSDQTRPILHFSHPHPLHPSDFQTLPPNSTCSACNLNDPMGPVYVCTPCSFTLHALCYQLPQQMRHPFDPNHALVLQPKPVYPSGLFSCDACRNNGPGFSYSCGPCEVDLHTTCATLPTQLTHGSHHHDLRLCFPSASYPGNAVRCDVCNRAGSGSWMYRCHACDFDAHLTCCVARLFPNQEQRSNVVNPAPIVGALHGPPGLPIVGARRGAPGIRPPRTNQAFNGAVAGGLAGQLAVSVASSVVHAATNVVFQGLFDGIGEHGGGEDDDYDSDGDGRISH